MNLAKIKQISPAAYPSLYLERLISRRSRRWLRRLVAVGLMIFIVLAAVAGLAPSLEWPFLSFFGLGLIFLAIWLKFLLIEAFFYSSYFIERSKPAAADFETALALSALSETDVTGSFLQSEIGRRLALRLGLPAEKIAEFLRTRVTRFALGQCMAVEIDDELSISLVELVQTIYFRDPEWKDFLFAEGIQQADLLSATSWLVREAHNQRERQRWWSRDALGRIPSIGKDWAFGQAFHLEKYSLSLSSPTTTRDYNYSQEEVKKLEAALAREQEANAMIVGDDEERKLGLLSYLGRLMEEGESFSQLEFKHIVALDALAFSAANDEKGSFERELIKILNEAVRAGNLILAIPEFTALARSAEVLGSDLLALLENYLASSSLQVVALVTTDEYHDLWEKKAIVTERFERILLKDLSGDLLLRILEDEAVRLESLYPIIFTAPALKAVAEGASRYLSEGTMPDAAIDLMIDLATGKGGRVAAVISKTDVDELIKSKTGIPVGAIGVEEREKLTNLETLLRERIVGQDEAVKGVADALRRARAGISNPNRPIGTFLFLGPTGVGKTEMTKALAASYFDNEKEIERLDMSEYSSLDALDKLIGSFSTGESGVLSDMIREHPYGILLLDEFEKAGSKVHNLFLQVLDEGFFSDMSGKRVSVRNHMIIATSNAGSDLIWQALQAGRDLLEEKGAIVDEIIKQGIFKPELLNRFDGVILFHPLSTEHLKKVAELMLEKLARRLREQGINLRITLELVNYLAEQGTDPKFGARAMNRAIQDKVEQIVANRIVAGTLAPGQELALSTADLK